MSRINLIILFSIIGGLILFLYGANFYLSLIGWLGVYLIIGGLLSFLLLYIYQGLFSKKNDQRQ
jgi:hypothetical protein